MKNCPYCDSDKIVLIKNYKWKEHKVKSPVFKSNSTIPISKIKSDDGSKPVVSISITAILVILTPFLLLLKYFYI